MGGKAAALAALGRAGFAVPPWVVVCPAAFEATLAAADEQVVQSGGRIAWDRLALPESLLEETHAALRRVGIAGGLLAVRSSAAEEDGADRSFAGQFESELAVPIGELGGAVVRVWASGFSQRVEAYREAAADAGGPVAKPGGSECGGGTGGGLPTVPAVMIQTMIDAEAAGVAFGADPVTGRWGVAVVSAVRGLGSALVGGEVDADVFRVDRDGQVVESAAAAQTQAHQIAAGAAGADGSGGVETVTLDPGSDPGKSGGTAITAGRAAEVAGLCRRCGRFFGRPQDIEWAVDREGKLHLLQSRPITALGAVPDPDGALNLWDNSNIAESYSGVTTPLTFSFARMIYEEVYRQFCLVLGVPRGRVEENREVFGRMLGLVRGRVFYNLLSWYRVLALLPGFTVNRRFMEQMMGVKEGLPDEVLATVQPAGPAGRWARWADGFALARSTAGLVLNALRLRRSIPRFYRRLDAALADAPRDLDELRADELAAHFHHLEKALLTRCDAPLVNDFFAMIFFGVLGKLTAGWCGDGDGSLHNALLCGAGDIVSAEPARRIADLAAAARAAAGEHPGLIDHLRGGGREEAIAAVRATPEVAALLDRYLETFGDRCLAELKLESPTLVDDPLPLLRTVGELASLPVGTAPAPPPASHPAAGAEAEVKRRLAGRPVRRLVFRWVLGQARRRVSDRENLRFERTRLFGRVRQIFRQLGRRLAATGHLANPDDIFYLEVPEVLGFVEGTTSTADLKGLAALRRVEFDGFRQDVGDTVPDDRFDTRGAVWIGNRFKASRTGGETGGSEVEDPRGTANVFNGTGCCPGVVRGPVRVVRDPRAEGASLRGGEILVAEQTDPGWILLFPVAAGLLVERGSLLSHSAIVSRELGLPAVVGLPGITRRLQTGDEVEMDGAAGTVRVVGRAPPV